MKSTPIKFQLLHVFTSDGRTFTFKNGTIIADNESSLAFTYGAVSDSKTKTGIFYLAPSDLSCWEQERN